MGRKVIAIWLCLTMMLGFVVIVDVTVDFTTKVGGSTIHVNMTGSDGAYTSIQDAINDSKDGDTVFVYNGTYYENVVVNKTINFTGEDRDMTVINGSGIGDVVNITVDWVNITGFTITNSGPLSEDVGIQVNSEFNTISYNNISSNNRGGLVLDSSNNNIVTHNKVYDNWWGIRLYSCSDNEISHNRIHLSTDFGIYLWKVSTCDIKYNNISSSNWDGLRIDQSTNINVTGNNFVNDGIKIRGGQLSHFDSHNITVDNMVNSKPVYYYKNVIGIDIDNIPVGQIILVNCAFINIRNLRINDTEVSIEVAYSSDINITDNNISKSREGIYLYYASNNKIEGNNISNNLRYGIYSDHYSDNNIIANNTVTRNSGYGLYLSYSSDNEIQNNNVSNNGNIFFGGGIFITFLSNGNTIRNNKISSNLREGICVDQSPSNKMLSNSLSGNSYYGIHVFSSQSNNISYNNVTHNPNTGILLAESLNTDIFSNNITDNGEGIGIDSSSTNNEILYNYISNNINWGIFIKLSLDNRIHHNNILKNDNQAYDDSNNNNQWDNGYPSGGNFWSDYIGFDKFNGPNQDIPGSDGIGDSNYSIDSDSMDNYPLISPVGPLVFLYEGWNLISLPYIQSDTKIESVLSSINGSYDAIQWYYISNTPDPWRHNHISKPLNLNDFQEINHTLGFWIHITEPGGVLFEYFGTQPTSNQTIHLYPGWNMLGYPSLTSYNRTIGLNNLTFDTHIDAIWTYNAATQKYKELTASDYFEIGRGYYIHAKEECTWEVLL